MFIRVDSCDYEVIREPSIVSVGVPTYIIYIYIKTSCLLRDFKRIRTIKQYFSLKLFENKLPCRFCPFRFGIHVFPVSGYPFLLWYTAAVSFAARIGRRDTSTTVYGRSTWTTPLQLLRHLSPCIYRGLYVKSFEIHCAHKVF